METLQLCPESVAGTTHQLTAPEWGISYKEAAPYGECSSGAPVMDSPGLGQYGCLPRL